MENTDEFRKQVKDALDHLYDTAYLETHPLVSQFHTLAADSRLTRAQKLRSLLKETIEALRPGEGSPSGSPEWRAYMALRYRYLQGLGLAEIESELGLSLRQLQRELHKGLDALAVLFREKHSALASSASDGTEILEHELNQWEITRQNSEVRTLVDDTLWMLKPILDERGVAVVIDSPSKLEFVFVDATLTRQALFKTLRALAQKATGSLSVRISEEDQLTKIILSTSQRIEMGKEEDWQVAQLICQQQSIPLQVVADLGTQISFALPWASQQRVLVIDDNAAVHQLFERYLAPYHYEIIHAHGGEEALQLAVEKKPEVITLDVMMPNVDGWQVLRGLMSNPATARIPVAICSVLKEPELAFSLGARAYLKKPVDRMELVTTLQRLLASADPARAVPQLASRDS